MGQGWAANSLSLVGDSEVVSLYLYSASMHDNACVHSAEVVDFGRKRLELRFRLESAVLAGQLDLEDAANQGYPTTRISGDLLILWNVDIFQLSVQSWQFGLTTVSADFEVFGLSASLPCLVPEAIPMAPYHGLGIMFGELLQETASMPASTEGKGFLQDRWADAACANLGRVLQTRRLHFCSL